MNNLSLFFSAAIYSMPQIEKGIADYQSICRIETTLKEDGVICTFSDSVADLEMTACEFANYLIELSNTRGSI